MDKGFENMALGLTRRGGIRQMTEFKQEGKYLVLKWEDIEKCLGEVDKKLLEEMCNCIAANRHYYGKKDNFYVVVNEDEPYAEQVWKLIEQSETSK